MHVWCHWLGACLGAPGRRHLLPATAGEDPCLGAVLVADGQAFFTLMKVTPMLLEFFRRRRDQQIMGLELLAISLGLSTFHELVVNRNVVIHCDNRGAEVCKFSGTHRHIKL